jgi:hypothetical protein
LEIKGDQAMNNKNAHVIFVTKQADGLFLAISIDSPRFCVSAATPNEALDKAQRALDYSQSIKNEAIRQVKPTEVRVITPVYEKRELRVA